MLGGWNNCNGNFQWWSKILFFTVEIGFIQKKVFIFDIGMVKIYKNVYTQVSFYAISFCAISL